jgi:dTDP-4-amino-4,6-dideoxygalactose transaminase
LFGGDSPDVVVPFIAGYSCPIFHLYVVRVSAREEVRDQLERRDIATGIHYPIPLHLQEAHRSLGYRRGSFPVTEMVASQVLSLPMFPQITLDQQQRVVDAIHRVQGSSQSCEIVAAVAAD